MLPFVPAESAEQFALLLSQNPKTETTEAERSWQTKPAKTNQI